MDDYSYQVRQIAQYPLIDGLGDTDVLLVQRDGLGGPYKSIHRQGLLSNVNTGVSIGLLPAPDVKGLVSTFLTTPLGQRQGYNYYVDSNGVQRYLQNGVAGAWSFGDRELNFSIAPWGYKDTPLNQNLTWGQPGPWQSLLALSFDGDLVLRETLAVGRAPSAPNEVTTKEWIEHNTLNSFNGRTGAVALSAHDVNVAFGLQPPDQMASQSWVWAEICKAIDALYAGQPFVYTFMGRVGDICLLASDVSFACTQPGAMPRANTPPLGDASNRIATTMFVDDSLVDLYQQIRSEIIASVDLSAYAKLDSPDFSGNPTAPTANPGTTTGQIATTAFVMNAVAASTAGVSSFNTRTGAVTLNLTDVTNAGGAPLASPAFTGLPQAPTATIGTNTQQIATTAFVLAEIAAIGAGVISFNTRTGAVTLITADITGAGGAPINAPNFTGVPTAPTAAPAINNTQIATTAYVTAAIAALPANVTSFNGRTGVVTLQNNDVSAAGGALIASPTFTGVPAAPTAAVNTNTTQLATCAFVLAEIAATTAGVTSFNGRTGVVTLTTADVTGVGGAPIASPVFTGSPAAPTQAAAVSDTTLATTAFVHAVIATLPVGVSSFNTRTGAVTLSGADISAAGGALLASPVFTGAPAAPTATPGTSTTQLATTAFVAAAAAGVVQSFNTRNGAVTLLAADITGAGGALLASPTFTGTPNAPTPGLGTNNTQIATCAFVLAEIAAITGVSSFNTRTGAVTLTLADVTATGVLNNAALTGVPTAPTAAPATNTTQVATTAYVDAATATGGFSTGDVKMTLKTVADTGWLMMDDTTFGSAASGANHIGAANQALFTLLFNNCADADVAIQTSTGAATTRAAQGTAAAAWTANCRMALPKALGRAFAGAGTGAGLTAHALGSTTGAETHTQTRAELNQHNHPPTTGSQYIVQSSTGGLTGAATGMQYDASAQEGAGSPFNILQPTSYLNVMVKL